MGNKMLIDAAHPEETRVVVLHGDQVEEFDYESATRKQLRGNIYLAKVTRVEPSLQAAFVDYGGNRHGFLAFNEIHPDYYQIPVADRKALLEEEARENRASARDEADEIDEPATQAGDQAGDDVYDPGNVQPHAPDKAAPLETVLPEVISEELAEAVARTDEAAEEMPHSHPGKVTRLTERLEALAESGLEEAEDIDETGDVAEADSGPFGRHAHENSDDANGNGVMVEDVGTGDALEELPRRSRSRRRNYKIQEVIKRRQILLVQVVKEERGNKGAALTTYLSLAGRYTVLMPNTASGGGISRKISAPADRKRLRQLAAELDVPEGMGLIIRTAGAARTKAEIKRDFEYLLRLWENVRDLTLRSTAPTLVYEEGNLIKRSIRDLYNKDIDEVLVAGEEAYKEAKEFMRMLMPSHAKNVKPYREPEPIFIRYNVERQLDAMYSPYITLKSGGYIVINQTEALVAIDVNSGKSTRQHSIEETALRTNLEAAEEISRQLRLRDLAGLIVIDFIDMEERRNNRTVERKLKECLRHDRARIQVGRISPFGLLEMSRQRMRTGVLEGSTSQCPMCQGTGVVRSIESVALSVLRALEDYLRTHEVADLTAVTSSEVALYILNNKRYYLHDIERRYGARLGVVTDERMHGGSFTIEKTDYATSAETESNVVVQMDWGFEAAEPRQSEREPGGEGQRKDRRKKRRSRGLKDALARLAPDQAEPSAARADMTADVMEHPEGEMEGADETATSAQQEEQDQSARKSRRRGRRGGRRQRARREAAAEISRWREKVAGETADAGKPGDAVAARNEEAEPTGGAAEEDVSPQALHEMPASVASAQDQVAPSPQPQAAMPEEIAEEGSDKVRMELLSTEGQEVSAAGPSQKGRGQPSFAGVESVDGGPDSASAEASREGIPAEDVEGSQSRESALAEAGNDLADDQNQHRRRGWWQRR